MTPRIGNLLLFTTVLLVIPICLAASTRGLARQAASASDLRQIAITFVIRYSSDENAYKPEDLQTMPDLLRELAAADLKDAFLFLSREDLEHIDRTPPRIIAPLPAENQTTIELFPELLEFPIAFSVAIYPDLHREASKTPLFWTRGLHRFHSFNRPYGGHIAFLDGHIQYFEGDADSPNEELEYYFGPESPFTDALRILEHDPEGWASRDLGPLPVRVAAALLSDKRTQKIKFYLWRLVPCAVVGAIAAAFPAPSTTTRAVRFFVFAALAFIPIALLVPSV
ncbi:hypothetical protein [Puniceicoccus vermicola]|uniref:Uncharacterized protein n=1 Tax=Puniceicoccus vermicola TaxID=388746 RepID=A0A7X1B2B7_9BACT|nr:hypothetical protein [Puniceicoccus vermicola]MBC2604232.1 hypothetical protein [Puniceicoccus vermicola]